MKKPPLVAALLLAGFFAAARPVAAGELQWGARSPEGSGASHASGFHSGGSTASHPGGSSRARSRHHDQHGGTHHDWHEGSHDSPREGWHSGRHHGTHGGSHHDWHDRSHRFEQGSVLRFRSKRFSLGLHGHESRSSFGTAGPPPWGAAGPPSFAPGGAPVVFISTPYFCHPHGIGFTNEREFIRHLHEEHGLSEHRALAFCSEVGGKLFFFGF